MRSLWPLLVVGLLPFTGLLAGCNKAPPRMKDQPTNLKSGEIEVHRPWMKKPILGAE
jgi:hypothetical protein